MGSMWPAPGISTNAADGWRVCQRRQASSERVSDSAPRIARVGWETCGIGKLSSIAPILRRPQPSTPNKSFQRLVQLYLKEGCRYLHSWTLKTLDQTVYVDYYLPGCPPHPNWILAAVEASAKNELPPKGSVIGPNKSVCDECHGRRKIESYPTYVGFTRSKMITKHASGIRESCVSDLRPDPDVKRSAYPRTFHALDAMDQVQV